MESSDNIIARCIILIPGFKTFEALFVKTADLYLSWVKYCLKLREASYRVPRMLLASSIITPVLVEDKYARVQVIQDWSTR
jgi:hypothetical protein